MRGLDLRDFFFTMDFRLWDFDCLLLFPILFIV